MNRIHEASLQVHTRTRFHTCCPPPANSRGPGRVPSCDRPLSSHRAKTLSPVCCWTRPAATQSSRKEMHRTRLEAARNCGAGAAPETALWGPKARLAAHPRPKTDPRPPPTAAAARPAARSRRTCQRGAQWTPPWPRAGAPAAAQRPPPSGNHLTSRPAGTPARPGTGLASGRDRFCPVDLVNTECQRHSRAGKKMLYLPLRLLEPQRDRRQKRSLGGKAG